MTELVPSVPGLVPMDVSANCSQPFEACGGLLAGMWIAEETCNSETKSRKALQLWGQALMNLDMSKCADAVQTVRSVWKGDLSFKDGIAIDTRVRHDMIEMELSRSCLNATYGVNISADKMPSVCSTLSRNGTSCTSVSGMCSCSTRREIELNRSGIYGVLGTSVAIGTGIDGPTEHFEYCVQGDTLYWREPSALRYVVLKREGAATAEMDPPYVR